jgi:competence protein ComEA
MFDFCLDFSVHYRFLALNYAIIYKFYRSLQMKKMVLIGLVLVSTLSFGMSVSELNKASKSELMKIKGVGESKANAIVKYRSKTKFKSVSDVEEVKGVGPALAKNIKNDVYKKSVSTKPKKETKTKKETKSKKEKEKEKK